MNTFIIQQKVSNKTSIYKTGNVSLQFVGAAALPCFEFFLMTQLLSGTDFPRFTPECMVFLFLIFKAYAIIFI